MFALYLDFLQVALDGVLHDDGAKPSARSDCD